MPDKIDLQTNTDQQFGSYSVIYSQSISSGNICYFAGHSFFGEYPDYLFYYLEKIVETGFEIIFISSSRIGTLSLAKLQHICSAIVEKENKGVDFGAWKIGLALTEYGKNFDAILLANDSVIGPFFDLKLIFQQFIQSKTDFYGLTRSLQRDEHIQSYFIFVNKNVVLSGEWKAFWNNLRWYPNKDDIVDNYEIYFTKTLRSAGFNYGIWSDWEKISTYEYLRKKIFKSAGLYHSWKDAFKMQPDQFNKNINPCSFFWQELIVSLNFPFLKRELVIYKNLNTEYDVLKNWQLPVSATGYKKDFISQVETLEEIKNIIKSHPFNTERYQFRYYHAAASPQFSNFNLLFDNKTLLDNNACSYLSVTEISSGLEQVFNLIYLTEADADDLIEKKSLPGRPLPDAGKNIYNLVLPYSNDIVPYLQSLSHPQTILFKNFEAYECAMLRFINQALPLPLSDNNAHSPEVRSAIDISDLRDMTVMPMEVAEVTDKIQDLDSASFFQLLKKYHTEYENLPMWYKKIGQVFKIAMGHKILKIVYKKRTIKIFLKHKITVNEIDKINYIRNWYYHEYDVLPGWYKKFGKLINKNK